MTSASALASVGVALTLTGALLSPPASGAPAASWPPSGLGSTTAQTSGTPSPSDQTASPSDQTVPGAEVRTRPVRGPAPGRVDGPALRAGWSWPLSPVPRVVRGFVRPASDWGPGHRGVDLAATAGQQVLAAGPGQVSHVGVVAGRGTVTVRHSGSLRTTYEPVTATVRRGDRVGAGSSLGVLSPSGGHCGGACLHLGALRGRVYLDPLVLLLGRRVVLLPLG